MTSEELIARLEELSKRITPDDEWTVQIEKIDYQTRHFISVRGYGDPMADVAVIIELRNSLPAILTELRKVGELEKAHGISEGQFKEMEDFGNVVERLEAEKEALEKKVAELEKSLETEKRHYIEDDRDLNELISKKEGGGV